MNRIGFVSLVCVLASASPVYSQGTVPTFTRTVGQNSYTLVGHSPADGGTTRIPAVLVPITISFDTARKAGKPVVIDASGDVPSILRSPVFSDFHFGGAGNTQYGDAMLRATFPESSNWHTVLARPRIHPVKIIVPPGYGYVLSSRKTGRSFAVVDLEFLQKELFKLVPRQDGSLIIAVTRNTAYYALGDATVCCSWGTHGVDSVTGNSFVLSSFIRMAPSVVTDQDVQPLTQQLAEFFNDPLHDPLVHGRNVTMPGNTVPAWMRPTSMPSGSRGVCAGAGMASTYFLLEPTNSNPKNNFPASMPFLAHGSGGTYHLQNVALLPWYVGGADGLGHDFSFPDAHALTSGPVPCAAQARPASAAAPPPQAPTVAAIPSSGSPNGHQLIGYWAGYGGPGSTFPLRDVSPQWDVIIVAFATPDRNGPEGTMQFHTPAGLDTAQFKSDIAYLKSQGKKVMISLGGGGQHFTLADPKRIPTFVSSVAQIVTDYGFDGIDLDFESPSLSIDPGDTDYKHPTTPSIVNLISALQQLHQRFGSEFMVSLVPEGTQIPSGYPSYGGQFGSYLPITYAIRDYLSFIDVQDYNTPPLQGLDGEIYQPGTVDYHAAMTELLLHGFETGHDPAHFFPPVPADKVAVGFLTGDTAPEIVAQAMEYIITGKAPVGTTYKLRKRSGYPGMIGAMFWTIDADRRGNYLFSNVVGPQLHAYPQPDHTPSEGAPPHPRRPVIATRARHAGS